MKDNCLDIGIIQAFLDGEVSHDESARISNHVAMCDGCAVMLATAEEESSVVFSALEREFDTLVPTHRLWNKINDSIRVERESRPFWAKAFAFLRVSLASPSMVAAASLFIVFGVFTSLWIAKSRLTADDGPVVASKPPVSSPAVVVSPAVSIPSTEADEQPEPDVADAPRIERAVYRPQSRREVSPAPAPGTSAAPGGYMPGEESYVRTIAVLGKNVEEQKEGVLRPSERIAYERDMAVVNDTIAKMRTELKRNPRNQTAKQILYSSYQNKIDLMNSVAQKEELVASLK